MIPGPGVENRMERIAETTFDDIMVRVAAAPSLGAGRTAATQQEAPGHTQNSQTSDKG